MFSTSPFKRKGSKEGGLKVVSPKAKADEELDDDHAPPSPPPPPSTPATPMSPPPTSGDIEFRKEAARLERWAMMMIAVGRANTATQTKYTHTTLHA